MCEEASKRCNKCKKIKSLTKFWKLKASKDGLQYYCKSCMSNATKIYRKENVEMYKKIYEKG